MGFDLGIGEIAATLASIAPYASLASGAVGALGALESGAANAKNAAYQSQVAANNAAIAGNQAQEAQASGEVQQEQQGLKTRAQVGAIEAAQAASNIEVNQPGSSAVDVRSSASALGELNALTIRSNTAQQVYGYQTAAASFTGQESLAMSQAAQAPFAAGINASTSLLSGATGAGRAYAGWQLSGGSGGAPASVWG